MNLRKQAFAFLLPLASTPCLNACPDASDMKRALRNGTLEQHGQTWQLTTRDALYKGELDLPKGWDLDRARKLMDEGGNALRTGVYSEDGRCVFYLQHMSKSGKAKDALTFKSERIEPSTVRVS